LNVLFIEKYGYIAAAWATLCAYGTMMFISYVVGRKHYPVPYNLKKSGGYLLVSVAIAYISFVHFRENYFISIGFLLLFVLMTFYLERKELKNYVKK